MAQVAEQTKRRLAVFDFDGTILRGQSGALISVFLARHWMVSPVRAVRLAWWGARYKLHLPYRENEARELVLGAVRELDAPTVDQLMRDFHDEVLLPRYRQAAVDEVRARRAEGCVVVLASATFQQVAERAQECLHASGAVATRLERDGDGNYTGRVGGEVVQGAEKLAAVRAWADTRFGQGSWTITYAYGDHHTDEQLLAAAEHPCVVNPGGSLRRIARKRGWCVLDWSDGPSRAQGLL